MDILRLTGVCKTYGQLHALNDFSFQISQPEIFGVIGPDGAGKTTLFRIIVSLLKPDRGTLTLLGKDMVRDYRFVRNRVGYMPGRFSLYQDLTVEENLNFFASIFNTSVGENYGLIKDIYVQIEPFKHRKAGKLSGGMKQKLALCCALVHKPKLLVLDEPTTGVDAVSRKEFWEMLKKLAGQGITILVATPYMDEAALCDRVALVQNGSMLALDRPEKIENNFDKPLFEITSDKMYELLYDLNEQELTHSVHRFGDKIHWASRQAETDPRQIIESLSQKGHNRLVINRIHAGIEDCFLELMNQHNS